MGGAEKGSEGAKYPAKMSFHVGQRVVCVDGSPHAYFPHVKHPVAGDPYTIREVVPYDDGTGVLLEEIVNDPTYTKDGFIEPTFIDDRFRPLDDLEQQLERIESEPVEEPEYA